MLKYSFNLLFLLTLIMGTILTISSTSWLGIWMGLEINLLSFIPLMSDSKNLISTEASLKYFLTQAIASSILLMSIIMMFLNKANPMFFFSTTNFNLLLILSSLMIKMGSAPFHFWLPMVMEEISWFNNLILMTWQKIGPLLIMSYMISYKFLMMITMMNIIMGSILGLNQTSIRKIMAFSSINHLGWMMSSLMFNYSLWLTYFLIYSFLSFGLLYMFNFFQIYYINQSFSLFNNSNLMKIFLFMNLLSLGGLPPFLGFLPKWLIIQSLIEYNQYFLMTFMMIFTLITLFFYLRISFSAFMFNYSTNYWNIMSNINNKFINLFMNMFSFISLVGLMIISMMMILY